MKKFIKGFNFAINGLKYTIKTQINFKVHLVAACLAISTGLYLELNSEEWLWISFAIGIVLIAELLNTAMEALTDLLSPEYNPKAGNIKDISAAMVLISSFLALVIGLLIFVPKLF